MTRYAWYDPALSPSPVLGWYDTVLETYPNLPPIDTLLELTEEQWQMRLTGAQSVRDGRLEPGSHPVVLPVPKDQPT